MDIFDHLLTPPLQNDNGSQHFYQLSEVSGGSIPGVPLVNEVE